ncbi:unnamed protein product [Dovyalis caffra]|uniref:Uncharacterized protein n=1 Tax=Dovyalis caffra TaxID=77055 RepID=A0AAV1RD18_9ROSI|nr:unnamed protein product [Dovyalis caffra]
MKLRMGQCHARTSRLDTSDPNILKQKIDADDELFARVDVPSNLQPAISDVQMWPENRRSLRITVPHRQENQALQATFILQKLGTRLEEESFCIIVTNNAIPS